MRVLFWYCETFGWETAIKTLEDAAEPGEVSSEKDCVVAFVHVEPGDTREDSKAETKLIKNAKWLAKKWDVKKVILHSFTHLGEEKAKAGEARILLGNAGERLIAAGYEAKLTPYGYFLDLNIAAPGHPLARIFKEF